MGLNVGWNSTSRSPQRVDSSGRSGVDITPHNTSNLPGGVTLGIYVGVTGDVSVVLENDTNPVTLKAMAAGVVHPFRVKKVLVTGTTATGLVAVY